MKLMHPRAGILFLSVIFSFTVRVLPAEELSGYSLRDQPAVITSLLKSEKDIGTLKRIIGILNRLDDTYDNLYERLTTGGAITVFFDPAHGKWEDGRWEGEATGRLSCTGLPEEHYSIELSRELYKLLDANRFIRVETTVDFLKVLKGKKDIYRNIPFTETVKLAIDSKSFIILSEHLNNISAILKAGGLANIPGIHLTESKWGVPHLTYIKDSHKGFLTLYNQYDATDMSRRYSLELKSILVENGMRANNWNRGAVPDDRFCYFVDFPVSVIFESGFISHPEEEAFLSKAENQEMIACSQYEALLKSLRDTFGVDISGTEPRRVHTPPQGFMELLKLSRIAIFYIQHGDTDRAIKTISTMRSKYPGKDSAFMGPYKNAAFALANAKKYYNLSKAHKKKNQINTSRKYARLALRSLSSRPLFGTLRDKYSNDFIKLGIMSAPGKAVVKKKIDPGPQAGKKPEKIYPTSKTTPVILAVEDGQNLDAAVVKALNPDSKNLAAITRALKNAHTVKTVKVAGRSKSGKKIYYWKKTRQKVTFTAGIYIVRFNGDLTVADVKRVPRVPLYPWKFQNHQYLKNSCFAQHEKERSL
ncbi:MAG TPA: hypothetical protein ENN21_04540 [Spirochaetes bacterium]|nr:hypothetical protein [Spirochaetota bacterium]